MELPSIDDQKICRPDAGVAFISESLPRTSEGGEVKLLNVEVWICAELDCVPRIAVCRAGAGADRFNREHKQLAESSTSS